MQQKSSYCKDVVKDVEHLQPADSDDINLTNLDLLKKKKKSITVIVKSPGVYLNQFIIQRLAGWL